MKVEISYANKVYEKAQKFHVRSARKKGNFDKVITYTEKDIDDEYIAKNEWAFSQERGGGYWIWKSYIISKTLKTLKDGDYLFYCDSGAYFIKPIDILIAFENGQYPGYTTEKLVHAFSVGTVPIYWGIRE